MRYLIIMLFPFINIYGQVQDFRDEKERYKYNLAITHSSMDIFNSEQKERSGGYDAVIISWSKVLVPVDKIVDRLRR